MTTPRKPVHTHKVRCQICSHPERHRIETLRLAGATADALVARFTDIGARDSVYRHMEKHVTPDVKAALIADVPLKELADRAVAESMSLLDYLSLVRSTVMSQMIGAASINDRSGTAKLAGRAVEVLAEIGRLTGELMSSAPVTNITNNNFAVFMASPMMARLEVMLLDRLAPHPAALQAVLAGLEDLDSEEKVSKGKPVIDLAVAEGFHAAAA